MIGMGNLLALTLLFAGTLPRVLFLTTTKEGNPPIGAHPALEAFSALGRPVKFSDLSILYFPDSLARYDVLIAPTLFGYHDGDMAFSLAHLDTIVMHNLVQWVRDGNLLIAGENIGRNTREGEDRVVNDGRLTAEEWPLGRAFGFEMVERNIQGFRLQKTAQDPPLFRFYPQEMASPVEEPTWILVPDSATLAPTVRVLAEWRQEERAYPAILLNPYGSGYALYISASLVLHPAFDGGYASIPEIMGFYREIYRFMAGLPEEVEVALNPWPEGARAALAITMDDGGTEADYRRVLDLLREGGWKLTFFATGRLESRLLDLVRSYPGVEIANHSQNHKLFKDLPYPESKYEILRAQERLGRLQGFRFPYLTYSPYGMIALDDLGYRYDSSIRVDHLETFLGAIFPYTPVLFTPDRYVRTLRLLELSPVYDDWYFYKDALKERGYQTPYVAAADAGVGNPNEKAIEDAAAAYYGYLKTIWGIIREARGLMVQMGHPMYQGHSERTLEPLRRFLEERKAEGMFWNATLSEITDWWHALMRVEGYTRVKDDRITVVLFNQGTTPVRNLSLRFSGPYLDTRVKAKGTRVRTFWRDEEDGRYLYAVFTLKDRAEITLVLR